MNNTLIKRSSLALRKYTKDKAYTADVLTKIKAEYDAFFKTYNRKTDTCGNHRQVLTSRESGLKVVKQEYGINEPGMK